VINEHTGIEVFNTAVNPDTNEEFVLFYYLPKNEEKMIAMPVEKFFEKIDNSELDKFSFIG